MPWPRSVWIDEEGVRLICLLLRPNMTVLEYGAGGSTTMFRSHTHTQKYFGIKNICNFQAKEMNLII